MYRHFLLLSLIERFKGDRSISAVYHLLTGKKTSQTIQDGFTYHVHPFFGGLPSLSRDEIDSDYQLFIRNHLVSETVTTGSQSCQLTEEGRVELARYQEVYEWPEGLNGWRLGAISALFWNRLALVIQTVSHLIYDHRQFVAITSHPPIQEWVKGFLLNARIPRGELAVGLLKELSLLIGQRPPLQQTLLTHRLAGFHKEGVTFDQLAYYLEKEKEELYLNFKAGIEACVASIQASSATFPFTSQLVEHGQEERVTQSAKDTLKWLKQGLNVEMIADRRGLKVSTIQDHFVELARFYPEPIRAQCLSFEVEKGIQDVLRAHPTRRLSELKKHLPDTVSFFQIRLALVFQEEGYG